MIRYIKTKIDIGSVWDSKIKVDVKHDLPDKIAIEFLTPTTFCGIGDYKWYVKDHFNSVFEFITDSPIDLLPHKV